MITEALIKLPFYFSFRIYDSELLRPLDSLILSMCCMVSAQVVTPNIDMVKVCAATTRAS